MLFAFGPQPGQILFFHGAPPGTAETSSSSSSSYAMERTDYNSPSPMARFAFASHRTFMQSHARSPVKTTTTSSGAAPDTALALRCSREYRMHLHRCHGEMSRLYGRLESGAARDTFDPMDNALMDSVARTVRAREHEIIASGEIADSEGGNQSFAAAVAEISQYLEFSELIWTLCELVHLRPPSTSVAAGIVQWALTLECWFDRTPFPDGYSDEELERKGADRFYTLRHHVTRNRLKRAQSCFQDMVEAERRRPPMPGYGSHSGIRGRIFEALDIALAERPVFKPTKAFRREWDRWKLSLRRSIEQIEDALSEISVPGVGGGGTGGSAVSEDELENLRGVLEIFRILNGDGISESRSMGSSASREVTWIPALVSELAFNRPGAVASEVARIMDRCIREVGSGDDQRDTIVDNMVQDALVASMLPVVIQDLFESGHMVVPGTQSRLTVPWVAAHLTDVLTIGGLIPEYAVDGMPDMSDGGDSNGGGVGGSLRDYYVETYASSLQRGGGADLAADYLNTCTFQSSVGHPRMHDMLTRAWAIQYTERATHKMVSIARHYGLGQAADEICSAKSAHWRARGRVAQSLQWLSRCADTSRLTAAVRSLLACGPAGTDYTALDTLVHGLEGSIDDEPHRISSVGPDPGLSATTKLAGDAAPMLTSVSQPVAFLSRYHEACIVLKNSQDLRREIEDDAKLRQRYDVGGSGNDAVAAATVLDERASELAKCNLRYLEAEAASRLAELLCSQSLDDNPTFWVPLLEHLEPLLHLRPPVVSAAHSRRVLAKLEEVTSSWRRDDYLPVLLPPWGEVQMALASILQTWSPSQDDIDTGRRSRDFPVSAGEYVTLRGLVPLLPPLERLELGDVFEVGGGTDGVKNWAEAGITRACVAKAYNQELGRSLRRKEIWDGAVGLMPRMRWVLTKNLAASLGEAHGSVGSLGSTISGGMISSLQPPVHRSPRPNKVQKRMMPDDRMTTPYE